MKNGFLTRVTAFTTDPKGGNPAGVWVGEKLPDREIMQKIAKEVGFSETVFIAPGWGKNRQVRYFSPEAEVPFCGHATIAAGVVIGEKQDIDHYTFATTVGEIPVNIDIRDKKVFASLTSVMPEQKEVPSDLLERTLSALSWNKTMLDETIPPVIAFAGNWHLILAVGNKTFLDNMEYDFYLLKSIMASNSLTTLQLIWRENECVYHSRNPFPVGGVIEDPATGASAAALGGYLRDAALVTCPAKIEIYQGEIMGRPSQISVKIPAAGGIIVSGSAVPMI
ncbi:MAG TPA: PhzF family phenazine biosynthesis isomerase [Aeromonadales bacterium]|nr:PhzF family phenazine biosynthesis isomerase [Aeromonadales bacterium]